jgi:arylsulfatase A-like enzyme
MSEEMHPMSRGFDEFFGFLHGGHVYFETRRKRRLRDPIRRGREPISEKAYLTDAFGREAVDFVRRHREKPWFLFLSFNAVHTPLQAKPEDVARFESIEDTRRRTYAGMLHAMDRSIGLVLEELERAGLKDETLIFYISDNGGPTRQTTSSNAPLRGFKGQVYEGGIRIPFVMRWDGHIPAGSIIRHPVSSLDVLATSLAAAGLKSEAALDGVDLLPLLKGETDTPPHEALFWRMGKQSAVRWQQYKLVRMRGSLELYDLEADIAETTNLALTKPEITKRLQALYADWERGTIPAKWKREPVRKR